MFIGKLARELFKSTRRKEPAGGPSTRVVLPPDPKRSKAQKHNALSAKRDNHGRFAKKK